MASGALQNRIAQLLHTSNDAAVRNDLHQAFDALKEASHLDPENGSVQDALAALERRERTGDAVSLLQSYRDSGLASDGERALHALRQKNLPPEDAEQAFHLLLLDQSQQTPLDTDVLDSLTATLIFRNKHVQHLLSLKFQDPVTELFDLLYDRGLESFKAFSTIPLNETPWQSKDLQARAQKDLFRLCIAKLIDTNKHHPERLMQVVARQLAMAPKNIEALIDDDVFEVILDCLDIRVEQALRSQAMLATSKLLEATRDKGEQLFGQYLAARVGKQTIEDFIVAFSSAAAVFPMIPVVAAQLFMTDGFVQQLVPNLERNFESGSQGKRKSATLEVAALELLSVACVDKACRKAIKRYCSPWLQNLSDEAEGKHQALASLVLAKISSETSEEITAKLADLVLINKANKDQAIEGLAYTTLQPKVKEEISSNALLLKQLVLALTDRPSAAFGCLTIFSNLTMYRPSKTAEQKKMEQLQAYANQQKPSTVEEPLDNDGYVSARAKSLLDADIVPALVASCKQPISSTNIAMVVRILLALAKEQKHRAKMVSQGAVKVLLQIRERVAKTDESTTEASIIDRNVSHALARLLISVNPAHVFSAGASPASAAVSSLVPLLTSDSDAQQRDLLPTFEGLLALTNLASMEDPTARDALIRSAAFEKLEDLLFSSNTFVQRASVELVCNLMASPAGVAKFANGSNEAKRRLHVLLALADAEDLATRRAAGGALAMLTEWDGAVSAVLDHERGVKLLVGMCEEDSDEIRHRGFVCVHNLVSAPGDVGKRGVQAVKEDGSVDELKEALKNTKEQEVLELGLAVLKKLQQ